MIDKRDVMLERYKKSLDTKVRMLTAEILGFINQRIERKEGLNIFFGVLLQEGINDSMLNCIEEGYDNQKLITETFNLVDNLLVFQILEKFEPKLKELREDYLKRTNYINNYYEG